jgi:indole-3-glycerol phosphate synthase
MPLSLQQILADTERTLGPLRARRADLGRLAAEAPVPSSFVDALNGSRVALIAEVKRRSPSAGSLREDLDPATRASQYASAGASAISVLTDGPHFGGSIEDLRAVASATSRPLLRKDFILAEEQILEARAAGASAVLLIVRALPSARLRALRDFAAQAGLAALVEAHTADEVARALEAGADAVGVNSRDLDTFRIDVRAAWDLLALVPAGVPAVAESGMRAVADVELAAAAGADAVLIGSALSTSEDPAMLAAALVQVSRRGR